MKPASLCIVPALVFALGLTGCNDTASRSDYPDRSAETKAEADAIRTDGDRREDVVDRDLQQKLTALGFEERQNADKAKLERDRIALDRDRELQPLQAKKAENEAQAKRECERIDRDTEAQLATTGGDEATRIKADAESRKAEVRRDSTAKVAEIDADIRTASKNAEDRIANVNRGEAKQQADIAAKRTAAENQAREEKLRIQADVATKLDRLGKDSADRRETQQRADAKSRETDQRITAKVQEDISRHGEQTRGVTVQTDNGVVVLGGSVRDDGVRRRVVEDTQRISGVVRVEDRIAVH